MAKRGRKLGTTTPNFWKSGPDPAMRKYYRAYVQQKNQANYRDEGWAKDFTYEVWLLLWGDLLKERGNKVGQCYMTRVDLRRPWHYNNVIIRRWGDEGFQRKGPNLAIAKVAMKATDLTKCQSNI